MRTNLHKARIALTLAACAVLAGIVAFSPSHAGILPLMGHASGVSGPASSDPGVEQPLRPAPELAPTQAPNYRAIVHQWGPAVVGITVEGMRKTMVGQTEDGNGGDDPFFQFFRGLPGFGTPGHYRFEQPFRGQGSGFIISTDGVILTNAHVVRDAQEVTVKLADRRELKAKVLGADPATDIAVLRVKASGLPAVRFGDPKTLEVGDYVLAIGAPFGFEQSVTAGIVSAKGRSLPGDAYVPFIQTDAAVNPGNSGGPLFDAAGDVVGINAQIYSQTGGYQGLSFAIPIDVALHAKDQIVATGHATHARLGVLIQDLNQGLADSFGLERPDGALVASVDAQSPAAAAGLKPGDVITQVDDVAIARGNDLSNLIGAYPPGKQVKLTVWRDHSAHDFPVTLAQADAGSLVQAAGDSPGSSELGLTLRAPTPGERSAIGADNGLVVESATGPAARAGLEPGDMLLGINGHAARSIEQVRHIVGSHPKSVALLIERDGQKIFIPVQLG